MNDKEPLERFFLRYDRRNKIGWTIMEEYIEVVGDVQTPIKRERFYHTSEDVAKVALQDLSKGTFDRKKYPAITPLPAQIVVFKEKHGEGYYIYTSREEFYKIFLKELTERKENGWFYMNVEEPEDKPEMTIEEIEKISDAKLKQFQLQRYTEFNTEMKEYLKEKRLLGEIDQAVGYKDGKLAYQVMEKRRNYEYEGFEIITPQSFE